MNVWIKRGLHTALLTGGLLALGAGAASADESSIEVTAPVTVCGTGIGVLGDATATCTTAGEGSGGSGGDGALVEVTAPVTVSGTAVGVLGDAAAAGSTSTGGGSGGNGAVVEVTAPVTVCGTCIGVLGGATVTCTTPGGASAGSGGNGSVVPVAAPVTGTDVPGEASATCSGPATPATPGGSTQPRTRIVSDPAATLGEVRRLRAPCTGEPGVVYGRRTAQRASGPDLSAGDLAYTSMGLALPVLMGVLTLAGGLGMTLGFRRRLDSAVQ